MAPLVITVGQTAQPAYPGTPFAGNLIAGASTGVQYAATAVTASRADGAGGLAMTVGTTDPAGRTIALDVRPDGTGFRVDAQVQGAPDLSAGAEGAKGTLLGDSFTAPEGEAFHGFGGRHESTDLRGTILDEWLSEEDFGAGPAQPAAGTSSGSGDAYLFPSGSAAAYYVQSAFVSQHYGFLLDQDEISHWQLAPPSTPDVWQVTAGADHLDALVLPGDPAASIPALTERTGRQRVPPRVGAAAAARPPRLRR